MVENNKKVWKAGRSISPQTGMIQNVFGLEEIHQDRMVDFHLRKATKGDQIQLLNKDYLYNISTYNQVVPQQYIYTYCYQQEENWCTYNQDYAEENFTQQIYTFKEDAYYRIVIKRLDNSILTEEDENKAESILLRKVKQPVYIQKDFLQKEIEKLTQEVLEIKDDSMTAFALLTDSHYVINGHWEDTAKSIRQIHKNINLDGIIHLGDLTDGMVPLDVTKEYVLHTIKDLKDNLIPVHIALGNHDSNYFANNPEKMDFFEQSRLYLDLDRPDYSVDYAKNCLRFIILSSFDYREEVRYGFSEETLARLRDMLESTPNGYSVIVCSHVPPLPEIHYWSDEIRNSGKLISILESYQYKTGNHIMAYLHGHNHADQIYEERTFPIVGIGCSKCEYFTDKKPKGSVTYERALGTKNQELWDVMMVSTFNKKIEFVRFGAGINRIVNCNKSLRRINGVIELDEDTLRQLQLIQVEMLIEVDRICKKCGIHYNIIAGTLLGAVRHGGYIPWDDDADIALLRDEYEKFRLACQTELDQTRFYFQDHRNTPGYRWGYGKIRRKNTIFLREHQEHMPYEQGVFIDIFPLDGVPDQPFQRKLHNFHCFCIRKLLWSAVGRVADSNKWMRKWYGLLYCIPERFLFSHYEKFKNRSNHKPTKLVRILSFPTPNKMYGYYRKWYEYSKPIKFESHIFDGIAAYDEYLSFKFGEYEKLPPEEERKVHPVSKIKLINE